MLIADKYHPFIFLDYEGKQNLLSIDEIGSLINQLTKTLILTVAVRAYEFQSDSDLWDQYLDLITHKNNLSFCIVAGHPAYEIDRSINTRHAFHHFFSQVRQRTDKPLFLGIENLSSNFANTLCRAYSPIIPLALNGDARLMNGFSIENKNPLAVYSPLATRMSSYEEIMSHLLDYLLRRKLTQDLFKQGKILVEDINHFSWSNISLKAQTLILESLNELIITDYNFEQKILDFQSKNIKLIVGYPAIPSIMKQQIKAFKIRYSNNRKSLQNN